MYNYLCKIESQLEQHISSCISSRLSRTLSNGCIILKNNSRNPLTVELFSDSIYVSFAGECICFNITDRATALETLETVGEFINELMTGELILKRIYHGSTQTKYCIYLDNKITKCHKLIVENVLTRHYSRSAPRLVFFERLYFY